MIYMKSGKNLPETTVSGRYRLFLQQVTPPS